MNGRWRFLRTGDAASRSGRLGAGAALALALVASLVGLAAGVGDADEQGVTAERAAVASVPPPGPHWVFVPDRIFRHSLLLDGDSGRVVGVIDSAAELLFPPPLWSRSRGEIYTADIVYSRGTRGERSDYVTIYDARTFRPVGEVPVPTRIGQSNVSYGYAELLGDRFVALFNQFPQVSVSIVDIEARKFVGEIPIAGCAGIYALAADRFGTLCGDGTALLVVLDDSGRLVRRVASAKFFDPVADPVAMPGGRDGQRWTFVSFAGMVHTVDFSGEKPVAATAWSVHGEGGDGSRWRPGGLQHVALHPAAKRLYVVMHEGEPGSHKRPGPEVWVLDTEEKKRVARFEPPNMTAAFMAGIVGVEPGTFAYRAMEWLLPNDGVHTIAVTPDDEPVLFARNAELGAVAVMDARTGETLRVLSDVGLTGPTLRVVE